MSSKYQNLRPFHQGRLDTFCSIYAVLNACRLLCGLRGLDAHAIFNKILLSLSASHQKFSALLLQGTDFTEIVDSMLCMKLPFPVEIKAPFREQPCPDEKDFWEIACTWLQRPASALIFSYECYLAVDMKASRIHWTAAATIKNNQLQLYDSGLPQESLSCLSKDSFTTSYGRLSPKHLVLLHASTLRLLHNRNF